jgi:non-canonical purine NTP pyrophosphatase (RdgB/HAM1 family)
VLPLVFVTQSLDKVAEARRILGDAIEHRALVLPEIQAVDLEPVVELKARDAYRALGGRPVLVEDTGLFIDAWNGLPGALAKWFVERVGPGGLCAMMASFANRTAWAVTLAGTYDGELRLFPGRVRGRIAVAPSGSAGFGWDSVFIPDGSDRTYAELAGADKDRLSMRRIALEAVRAHHGRPRTGPG